MLSHTTGLFLRYSNHRQDVQSHIEGWIIMSCPTCQDGHGQLHLNILSGHYVCLTWSLTNDDEASAVSARGGGRLGPYWLARLVDNTMAQSVAAS